jgi:cardiolipin synthase
VKPDEIVAVGSLKVSVIDGRPETMGLYRLELLVAQICERSLWLADAYFVATTGYVHALCRAARAGVDVRLLVPGSSNHFLVQTLSRSSYRPLLEAGVRVFEWNGPMMHAKTAVADGSWSRIGSSNSNLSSWIANRELDITVEDEGFAKQMEAMYEHDLELSTEILLKSSRVVESTRRGVEGVAEAGAHEGGTGRLVAGVVGFGSAVGAALTQHRAFGASESNVMAVGGALLLAMTLGAMIAPALVAYPLAILGAWAGVTLVARAVKLRILYNHSNSPNEDV